MAAPVVVGLTARDLRVHARATREFKQFCCTSCQRDWWRLTDPAKPVSTCKRCKVRFDALSRDQEFGYGHFTCSQPTCLNKWTNTNARWSITQDCHGCGHSTLPSSIGPRPRSTHRKTKDKHSCAGCASGACKRERPSSRVHVSTGRTVSTTSSCASSAFLSSSLSALSIGASSRGRRRPGNDRGHQL